MKFGYAWTFVNKPRGETPAPPPGERAPALPPRRLARGIQIRPPRPNWLVSAWGFKILFGYLKRRVAAHIRLMGIRLGKPRMFSQQERLRLGNLVSAARGGRNQQPYQPSCGARVRPPPSGAPSCSGSMETASPVASSVSISTPQIVAGPIAGVKRPEGIRVKNR